MCIVLKVKRTGRAACESRLLWDWQSAFPYTFITSKTLFIYAAVACKCHNRPKIKIKSQREQFCWSVSWEETRSVSKNPKRQSWAKIGGSSEIKAVIFCLESSQKSLSKFKPTLHFSDLVRRRIYLMLMVQFTTWKLFPKSLTHLIVNLQ